MKELGIKSSGTLTNLLRVKAADPHLRMANGLDLIVIITTNGSAPFSYYSAVLMTV